MTHCLPIVMLAAVLTLLLTACGENRVDDSREGASNQDPDSAASLDPVDGDITVPVVVDPSGRTELPTYNTGAGPLFISLPENYSVRADQGMAYDMIFVYRNDDPVIEGGSDEPPVAIARLYIGDSAVSMDVPGRHDEQKKMVVAGVPVTAELYQERIPEGGVYRSYTIELPHFFASRDRSLDDLQFHLYVGGRDTAAVDRLLEALTTLSFQP